MDETWIFIDARTNGPTDRQRDRDRTVGKVISTILFDLYQIDVRYSRKEEGFLFFTVFDKKVQSIAITTIKHIYIYSLIRKASERERVSHALL